MVNKQTAVEWLELMVKIGEVIDDDLFKQAKAMEKEQIFNSYEEAELACLDKLIEIVESKQRINRIIKDVQDGK